MGLNADLRLRRRQRYGRTVAGGSRRGVSLASHSCYYVCRYREKLFTSLPHELYPAVAVGIGLFIAFIGFRNTGLIVSDPATTVTLQHAQPHDIAGRRRIADHGGIAGAWSAVAILIGILTITAASAALGLTQFTARYYSLSDMQPAFQLTYPGPCGSDYSEILFVFLFVDLFDNLGTPAVVSNRRLMEADGRIPRINRILMTDATATMVGACAGTSTVVSYIESTADIVAGGRSGVTSIVTGVLFLILLFLAPLAGLIPAQPTVPHYLLGAAMLSHVSEIDWKPRGVAIPAFLTLTVIPLSFSIANGLALPAPPANHQSHC